MSATTKDDPRKPKGIPADEPKAAPVAEPAPDGPPAPSLEILYSRMHSASADAASAEADLARELERQGFTPRKKKVASVGGKLLQASAGKVVELGT